MRPAGGVATVGPVTGYLATTDRDGRDPRYVAATLIGVIGQRPNSRHFTSVATTSFSTCSRRTEDCVKVPGSTDRDRVRREVRSLVVGSRHHHRMTEERTTWGRIDKRWAKRRER